MIICFSLIIFFSLIICFSLCKRNWGHSSSSVRPCWFVSNIHLTGFLYAVTDSLVLSESIDMFSSLKARNGPLLKTDELRYGILLYIASHSRQLWCVCSSLGIFQVVYWLMTMVVVFENGISYAWKEGYSWLLGAPWTVNKISYSLK